MISLKKGDCLTIMKKMKDNSVDLIFTDPPYGINACKGVGGFGSSKTDKHYKEGWDLKRPDKIVFKEMLRISKKAIIFGGNYFADILPQGTRWLVWDKKGEVRFKNPYSDCELLWTNLDEKTIKKYLFKQQGFIKETKDKRIHPTQKPSELIEMILRDYTDEEMIILDPFMGSGSTGVACKRLNRSFIGIEIDDKYFDLAEKRILNTKYYKSVKDGLKNWIK